MYDNSLYFSALAEAKTTVLEKLKLQKDNYILATLHRDNNTDQPERLSAIFAALYKIVETHGIDIVMPLHPRTAKLLDQNLPAALLSAIRKNTAFKIIAPVSFLEMIALEKNCRMVMTDSGGVQKEAFFFQKPCIIFRHETEWTELVSCGSATIVDADAARIAAAFELYFDRADQLQFPLLFGDGKAAHFICNELIHANLTLS